MAPGCSLLSFDYWFQCHFSPSPHQYGLYAIWAYMFTPVNPLEHFSHQEGSYSSHLEKESKVLQV